MAFDTAFVEEVPREGDRILFAADDSDSDADDLPLPSGPAVRAPLPGANAEPTAARAAPFQQAASGAAADIPAAARPSPEFMPAAASPQQQTAGVFGHFCPAPAETSRPPPRSEEASDSPHWESQVIYRQPQLPMDLHPVPQYPSWKVPADVDHALRKACHHRDLEGLRFALTRGGAPGMYGDGHGKTALHIAARSGFWQGLHVLLDLSFNPNHPDMWGGRPVDEAEYWAVKGEGREHRAECLHCRDYLVLYGGRRSVPSERADHPAFLDRRSKLENLARMRDGMNARVPWQDDLDTLERMLRASSNWQPNAIPPNAIPPNAAQPPASRPQAAGRRAPQDPESLSNFLDIRDEYQRQAMEGWFFGQEEIEEEEAELPTKVEPLDPSHEIIYL